MIDKNELKPTPDCCEVWPKLLQRFQWCAPDEYPDLLMMPFLRIDGVAWRINFCPSCGKEVRSCIVDKWRVW